MLRLIAFLMVLGGGACVPARVESDDRAESYAEVRRNLLEFRPNFDDFLVDGPLAMDNAIDLAAARTKGIHSPVAGRAQVLIVPNLEAGNMLAKQLTFLGGADAAGIVLGARVPIVLTSRADSVRARMAS